MDKFEPTEFIPGPDRVLLQRIPEEATYHGVIYYPDKSIEKPQICRVIAICPSNVWYAVGDFVLIGKYSGTDISIGDDKYIIVKEEDILGRCK